MLQNELGVSLSNVGEVTKETAMKHLKFTTERQVEKGK